MTTLPEVLEPLSLERLSSRVEDLERRIAQLEQLEHLPPAAAGMQGAPTESQHHAAIAAEQPWQAGPALTVIGIALLGIAGAYMLRAVAAAAVLPRLIPGATGALYATAWAVAAMRSGRRFAGPLYAATSVLILAPMLWEMCLRFQAMSAPAAALILSAYLVTVCITARRAYGTAAFSLVFAGGGITALALCIGSRAMLPFIAILLAMMLFCEFHRISGETLPAAPVVALTANAAVWALLFIYRMPAASRPEYPALGAAMVLACPLLLFLLQIAMVTNQACLHRQRITVLEAIQSMATCAVFALGIFWILPSRGALVIGILCLALCAGCYWAAWEPARRGVHLRNDRLFTAWALVLLIAGLFLLLPIPWASVCLATAAMAAIAGARRLGSMTLKAHALVYLILGAMACGLPAFVAHALTLEAPSRSSLFFTGWSTALVTAISVAAFAACHETKPEDSGQQALHLAFALLATCAACAFLTQGLLEVAALAFHPQAFHIALLRTIALCAAALGLALGGVRLRRPAMTRAAYVLLALTVLKLVVEDLRHGHLAYLAASIGSVAVTLIVVPHAAARGQAVADQAAGVQTTRAGSAD